MIPTMQPPTTAWSPETQHLRSNGIGRQTEAINNPGFGPFAGFPVAGMTPTLTPYGTVGFVPTATPFFGTQPFANFPTPTMTPYNSIPTTFVQTPFGVIPTPCGTIPTSYGAFPTNYGAIPMNYGTIPTINPLAINPLLGAIGNPFMNIAYTTTNPYNIATLANCGTGMCVPSVQPMNAIPASVVSPLASVVSPLANVAYSNVGNPFFRPVGAVGGIDAINSLVGGHVSSTGFAGITPYTNASIPFGGIATPAIRTTPFQTMIPTTTPFVGNSWNTLAGAVTSPFGTTIPVSTVNTPFGTIPHSSLPFATSPINAINNPWLCGVSGVNPLIGSAPWNTIGLNNPLTAALVASNYLGACQSGSSFQPIGINPFINSTNSICCTPWNTATTSGFYPYGATPTFINTALTHPASLLAAGCSIC